MKYLNMTDSNKKRLPEKKMERIFFNNKKMILFTPDYVVPSESPANFIPTRTSSECTLKSV
jgi:hypothetical protein